MKPAVALAVLFAVAWGVAIGCGRDGSRDATPRSLQPMVQIGDVGFQVELATTLAERLKGLSGRESLPRKTGMLFIFDSSREVSFWMKNTLIPLDIIFITEHGFVTNIAEADPELGVADADLTRYQSDGHVLYVVEINQGLAAANGIHTGTYVNITYSDG